MAIAGICSLMAFWYRLWMDAAPSIERRAKPHTVLLIVASAMFMEQLDGTVLATALPTMARSFDADPLHMNIALTSYLLTLAMFIPASGRIADRFGSRSTFRAAIGLFTLAILSYHLDLAARSEAPMVPATAPSGTGS